MDYLVAVIIYFCSIAGIALSVWGMITGREDPKMVGVFSLTSFVFSFTLFISGVMINASNQGI
jgi:hypothetical protein